jgi:hypothetical protein
MKKALGKKGRSRNKQKKEEIPGRWKGNVKRECASTALAMPPEAFAFYAFLKTRESKASGK